MYDKSSEVALVLWDPPAAPPDHRRESAVCYQDTSYVYVRVAGWLGSEERRLHLPPPTGAATTTIHTKPTKSAT